MLLQKDTLYRYNHHYLGNYIMFYKHFHLLHKIRTLKTEYKKILICVLLSSSFVF